MTATRGFTFFLLVSAFCSMGLTCEDPSLTITPTEVPNGVVGQSYTASFTAGGSSNGAWSVISGELPNGMSLNRDDGRITGSPTAAGDSEFTIGLNRFPFGGSSDQAYQITVHPRLVVTFSPTVGRQGTEYAYTIGATGGVPPYEFDVIGLPAGLTVNATTGEITGTPIEPEEGRTLEVTVTDSGDPEQSETETATFRIRPPSVEITTDVLPPGRVTVNYDEEIEIENGQSPFTFEVTDGVLPPGLALPDSQSNGRITGVPTEADTFTFTITVTDSDDPSSSDSKQYTITIAPE